MHSPVWRQPSRSYKALQCFCFHICRSRASAEDGNKSEDPQEDPIGLASDGSMDAEMAKLLSEIDEVNNHLHFLQGELPASVRVDCMHIQSPSH